MSFHSRLENVKPYIKSGYAEVYEDCSAVHREILRFAGEKSLSRTTTIHYAQTTEEGLRALYDNGVRGLLGLFGTDEKPCTSYSLSETDACLLRKSNKLNRMGIDFFSIDLIMNQHGRKELKNRLSALTSLNPLFIMIHEQYFYPDYAAYQPDFEKKLEDSFDLLLKNGYESCFAEEL